MPTLRNPGLYSVLIFAIAAALVAFLTFEKVPDAAKLGGELLAVAIAAFGAKSALAKRPPKDTTTSSVIAQLAQPAAPPPPAAIRGPLQTWPGLTPEEPPTLREPPKGGAS